VVSTTHVRLRYRRTNVIPVRVGSRPQGVRLPRMDTETKRRIEDFFTGTELVDFLCIDVSEIIERFEDEVESVLDEIEELMQVRGA
jgi:hypothetical protein